MSETQTNLSLSTRIIWHLNQPLIAIKGIFYSLIYYKTIKVYLCNHITIGIKTLKLNKTKLPHPVGIVIGQKVKIGQHCTIYQNVTIGTKDTSNFENAKYPEIGNNVIIYANSIIFGDISIGDNVIIGAGSVVYKSIQANSIIAGNPAKLIGHMEETHIQI